LADVAKKMTSLRGDVLDLECLRSVAMEHQPEVVFHLAAQSLVRHSYTDPVGTFATNVMGTVNLLEAVRVVPSVQAVLVITTDKCYESLEHKRAYRETDPLGGSDPYSGSKASAEIVTQVYRRSFFQVPNRIREIGVATARAGNVIGGGDWAPDRLIPDTMRAVLEGKEVLIRNPQAIRPWQHVVEPLYGYLLLAEKLCENPGQFSGSWNFGPEEADSLPVSALLNRFVELWGPGLSWRVQDGQHPHEAGYLKLDSAKSRRELCWTPTWKLDCALKATVDWYKAYQSQHDVCQLTRDQIRLFQQQLRPMEQLQ
jgi:CDP-glucose 4,6-dehydratase